MRPTKHPNTAPNMDNSGKTIEQIYQKKTQLEHILLRPDTYIGSVERQRQNMWVLDPKTQEMVYKEISYVPGLYKIFGKFIYIYFEIYQGDFNCIVV